MVAAPWGFKVFFIVLFSCVLAGPIVTHVMAQPDVIITQQEETKDVNDMLKDAFATGQSYWYILILAFLAGILVSFTPCVYPMIPITVGVLQSQASKSLTYNFLLSLSYITGIALVYAGLGYISATSAIIFGKWLASPWFIGFIIFFFLYMAFAMFGYYDLYVPSFLIRKKEIEAKGSIINSFVYGIISGTVASPCLTPALAIILSIVAKQANPVMGFLTMFSFAFGMGILLMFIGAFSSTVSLLPQAGAWMNMVKKIFGFMMLIVCVYFLQPFLGLANTFAAYAAISGLAAGYYLLKERHSSLGLLLGILWFLGTLALAGYALRLFM